MRIFLSYSRADAKHAEQVAAALKQSGHKLFFDRQSIQAAEDFNRIIWEEIQKSDLFIYLVSPNSVRPGSYALTEISFAEKKWPNPERHVLAVVVEATEITDIPVYATICHMLRPAGNVAAEVRAEVNRLQKKHRLRQAARLAVLLAALVSGGGLVFLGYREYLDQRPLAARVSLSRMDVAFDPDAFVDQAHQGNLRVVDLFLKAGMAPSARDGKGNTALIMAVAGNHLDLVKRLIEARANVDAEGRRGVTALEVAARLGREDMVRELLAAGAGAEAVNAAFVAAGDKGKISVLRLLLSRDIAQAAIDEAFVKAAGTNSLEILNLLRSRISDSPETASRALHLASFKSGSTEFSEESEMEIFQLLFELGANVHVVQERGISPLIWVLHHSRIKLAELLLLQGADPNEKCECLGLYTGGWTPLTLVIKQHGEDEALQPMLDLLMSHGADVNLARENGETPLMQAAEEGNLTLVEFLIEKGARINEQDKYGYTALAHAAAYREEELVTKLLQRGADVHVGTNPLLWAVGVSTQRVVEILLASGVDVNESDSTGRTPLIVAADQADADMVRLLLAAGARADDKDEMGRTAEIFAKRRQHSEILELLREAETGSQ